MKNFINRVSNLFGGAKKKEEPEPSWIESEDNRFGIRILDCRTIVGNLTAWTSNKDIAETYNLLRTSDGTEHVGQELDDGVVVPVDLQFPYNGKHDEGPVFKAAAMEDKWDMYLHGDRLYISRSWTGQLCFLADCAFKTDRVKIFRVVACKEFAEGEPAYVERLVDFLVKSHMSNMEVPHPLPKSKCDLSANELAQYSFSVFGRRALFGTFEETKNIWGQQSDAH